MVRQHIQRISKIVSSKIAVPAPMGIWIGIMARTAAAGLSMVRTAAHFMPVRAGMSMDAGPVTGKRDAILMDKATLQGWKDGGGTECLLKKLFVIKRKFIPGKSFPSHNLCNFGMAVWKFFPFCGFISRLSVFVSGEKVLPGGFLELFILEPEAVNKIIIRAKRRQGVRRAAN